MRYGNCAACHQRFRLCPQVPGQCYCSLPACQRERRRLWQKAKRHDDPDYRENQDNAHRAWSQRSPDYWREYRANHPEYAARNRAQQRGRTARDEQKLVANMDESRAAPSVLSGIYRLIRLTGNVANMDSWTVEIRFLSEI